MRRLAGLLLVMAAGCSTAPLADALDFAFPPRVPPPGTPTYGGVGVPRPAPLPGAIIPPPALPAQPASPVPPVPQGPF